MPTTTASGTLKTLFEPTTLGELQLKNKVVYPAMTRARCPGRVPNSENVKYYAARSSAGMVVTEPSAVSEKANGFIDAPGMYTDEHVRGWSDVTAALHAEGCTVVCQLWHTGRMSHSSFRKGKPPVAPSAIQMADVNGVPTLGVQGADGKWHEHELPVEMTADEISEVVAHFGRAASLAKAAGFDGVEIHAGSGYLLDTFLQPCSNTREDAYGGSPERRFALLSEVLTAVASSFPMGAVVGVKITPNNGFNGMGAVDVRETFLHVASRLGSMGVGYLHVTDGVGQSAPVTWFGRVRSSGFHGASAPITLADLRAAGFGGALVGNGGYTAEAAAARIDSGEAAAISFGRVYMSNPDLVERFKKGHPLAPLPPKDEWFVPNETTRADPAKGYTEYKSFGEADAGGVHTATSPLSMYTAFADVDAESAGAWQSLEEVLAEEKAHIADAKVTNAAVAGAHGVSGAVAAHAPEALEEAARKMLSNHVRVLHDLTNASARVGIDNKPLTQPFVLRRVAPDHRALADGFLRELTRRLLRHRQPTTASLAPLEASQPLQAAVWVASAAYLEGRIQSTAEQMPGRKPDMTPAAAAAMKAVMAEMSREAAPLAAAAPSVLVPPPSEPASPDRPSAEMMEAPSKAQRISAA